MLVTSKVNSWPIWAIVGVYVVAVGGLPIATPSAYHWKVRVVPVSHVPGTPVLDELARGVPVIVGVGCKTWVPGSIGALAALVLVTGGRPGFVPVTARVTGRPTWAAVGVNVGPVPAPPATGAPF